MTKWEKSSSERFYFLGLQNQCGRLLQANPGLHCRRILYQLSYKGSSDVSWTIKKAERQRIDAFEI